MKDSDTWTVVLCNSHGQCGGVIVLSWAVAAAIEFSCADSCGVGAWRPGSSEAVAPSGGQCSGVLPRARRYPPTGGCDVVFRVVRMPWTWRAGGGRHERRWS
jgi:hypothetical protein